MSVIAANAPYVPAKTAFLSCCNANNTAMKKVLSPISLNKINNNPCKKPPSPPSSTATSAATSAAASACSGNAAAAAAAAAPTAHARIGASNASSATGARIVSITIVSFARDARARVTGASVVETATSDKVAAAPHRTRLARVSRATDAPPTRETVDVVELVIARARAPVAPAGIIVRARE